MKKSSIVRSQPKLITKNPKIEMSPPTPIKQSKNKLISFLNKNQKENQMYRKTPLTHKRIDSALDTINLNEKIFEKKLNPMTTKAANTYSRNFLFSKQKEEKKNKISEKNLSNLSDQKKNKHHIMIREKLQPKKLEVNRVNDKVKELEDKINRIKQEFRKPKQQQPSKQTQNQLSSYLTQFPSPSTLIQVCSQKNILNIEPKRQTEQYYISAIKNSFSEKCSTSFMQLARNHLLTSLQVLKYTKTLHPPTPKSIRHLPKTHRKTIVFDLDETLIHCNQNIDMPHDVLLDITFPNGESTRAGINVRMGAVQCLKDLAEHFQIIVFTASHQCYANVVIDYLDPKRRWISYRYFRDSCYRTNEGFYIKDLRIIDRPLENLLLVDNAAYSYAFQLENGVPIIPFYDNKADNELKMLSYYLKSLKQSANFREQNNHILKLSEYTNFTDPYQLINALYK